LRRGIDSIFKERFAVIASEAKQSILSLRGIDGLLRYARNDVDRHDLTFSRRDAPEGLQEICPS
jgi:hypothetical protein